MPDAVSRGDEIAFERSAWKIFRCVIAMAASSNHTDCGSLYHLFPVRPPNPTPTLTDDPGSFVIQGLPTLAVLVVWLFSEVRKGRPTTGTFRTLAIVVSFVAAVAQSLMIWHTFEWFKCEGQIDVESWAIVTVLANAFAAMLLMYLLLLTRWAFAARLGVIVLVSLAAGTVFADWCLRGGFAVSRASHLLVAIQQTYLIQAVSTLYFIDPRKRKWTTATKTRVRRHALPSPSENPTAVIRPPIDSLARRIGSEDCPLQQACGPDRSWFAV